MQVTTPLASDDKVLGNELRPPIASETQPPLARQFIKDKRSDMFPHLYFRNKSAYKVMMYTNKQ